MAFGALKGNLTAANTSPGTGLAATGSVTVALGDLILCHLATRGPLSINQRVASDNLGNKYFPIYTTRTGATSFDSIIWAAVATVAGTLTSVQQSQVSDTGDSGFGVSVFEGPFLSDYAAVDIVSNTGAAGSTSPQSAPASGVLSQADELVVGFFVQGNGTATSNYSATAPWSLGATAGTTGSGSISGAMVYRAVAATTSVTPSLNIAAGVLDGNALTISFRKSTGQSLAAGHRIGTFTT